MPTPIERLKEKVEKELSNSQFQAESFETLGKGSGNYHKARTSAFENVLVLINQVMEEETCRK